MRGKLYCFVIVAMYMMSWMCASPSMLFSSHAAVPPQPDQVSPLPKAVFHSKQYPDTNRAASAYGEEEVYRELTRLGSRPPNCNRKCGLCTPCIAIQIPATNNKVGLQYTNYEPEGWKCKCGTSFFNP